MLHCPLLLFSEHEPCGTVHAAKPSTSCHHSEDVAVTAGGSGLCSHPTARSKAVASLHSSSSSRWLPTSWKASGTGGEVAAVSPIGRVMVG